MNALAASVLPAPTEEECSPGQRDARRRRFLEAALLAQPTRETVVYRPYSGSGFSRALAERARMRGADAA